jgi:DNA-binding response OmpR family regulator
MAYLVKPFNVNDLIPAIEVAVSRFSEIEEDEPPWRLLVSDYEEWLARKHEEET